MSEMSWQKHEEGTHTVSIPDGLAYLAPPVAAMHAKLIDSDMERIRQMVESSVRRALFGDPPDPDDLPVRRDGSERGEASIVTVADNARNPGGGSIYRLCSRCHLIRELTVSRANPEIARLLDTLAPFLAHCLCGESR